MYSIHESCIFLDSNNFFNKSRHRFCKGYSCETQMAVFIYDLHSNLDSDIQTDAIFFDFSKAFLKIPHKRLLPKFAKLNLNPGVFDCIKQVSNNRSQSVLINNCSLNFLPVTPGVPRNMFLVRFSSWHMLMICSCACLPISTCSSMIVFFAAQSLTPLTKLPFRMIVPPVFYDATAG